MRARCGQCGGDFAVGGPGRYRCPACGAVNEVRGVAPGGPPPGVMPDGPPPGSVPRPPPAPDVPSERVACPDCAFSFIVGSVDVAVCPMCSAEVSLGFGEPG